MRASGLHAPRSVREARASEEELFRNRDAIVRLMMWSMLYLEKRTLRPDRMPMEGVRRAFLESYIAVPAKLAEECPPDFRKAFWLVDAGNRAFLQRMEKEKLAGEELRREYGVHVEARNELLLPVVFRHQLSGRFQQVERELRKQMEGMARSLPPLEKRGNGSPEEKDGEKTE